MDSNPKCPGMILGRAFAQTLKTHKLKLNKEKVKSMAMHPFDFNKLSIDIVSTLTYLQDVQSCPKPADW